MSEIFFTANIMYADCLQTCIFNKDFMSVNLNQHQAISSEHFFCSQIATKNNFRQGKRYTVMYSMRLFHFVHVYLKFIFLRDIPNTLFRAFTILAKYYCKFRNINFCYVPYFNKCRLAPLNNIKENTSYQT